MTNRARSLSRYGAQAAFTLERVDNSKAAERMRRRASRAGIDGESDRLLVRFLRFADGHSAISAAVHSLGVGVRMPGQWASRSQRLPAKYHLAMDHALTARGF